MKKIFQLTQWANQNFTADNVTNKTHWFIKAVDEGLKMIGVNDAVFAYSSSGVTVTINGKSIKLFHPNYNATYAGSYCMYVNSEERVIFGLATLSTTFNEESDHALASGYPSNFVRGFFSYPYSAGPTGSRPYIGGYLAIKVTDDSVIGYSSQQGVGCVASANPAISDTCLLFPPNYKAEETPIQKVKIRCHKAPIYDSFIGYSNRTEPVTTGKFFESIRLCQQYYLGSVKTEDNKKFIFGGYMFDVDDAIDVGTIEVTI